jgi:hypothetical protein
MLNIHSTRLDSFAKVFNKLIELGVPTAQFQSEPYHLKTMDEQDVQR